MCSVPPMPSLPPTSAMAKNPDSDHKVSSASGDRKKALSSMGIESTKLTGVGGVSLPANVTGKKLLGE